MSDPAKPRVTVRLLDGYRFKAEFPDTKSYPAQRYKIASESR
jgi:hypothetical protein